VAGRFDDGKGHVVRFDSARAGEEIYTDLSRADGFQILHIETTPTHYELSYMGGKLKLHADRAKVAEARQHHEMDDPEAASTDGFVFEGDINALDEMLHLPEAAALPWLSRALGARGVTGRDFPAALAIHKMARESASGLGIEVPAIEQVQSQTGYCTAYPNRSNNCYGMCGSGCSCWSWVCGDCCYHGGCAKHDSWCREGKWYYCYNISAVIALFGC
jgi:hypothetical protein